MYLYPILVLCSIGFYVCNCPVVFSCSGHFDGTVRLWQYTNAEVDLIVTLGESRSSPVTALTLTYTCSLLAVGDEDGRVSVWDMEVSEAKRHACVTSVNHRMLHY